MSSPERFAPSASTGSPRRRRQTVVVAALVVSIAVTARATLPPWLQHVVGGSTIESALYRVMPLPSVQASYPRPPREA